MKPYRPYTYLIGWTKLDKWYYGVEYGKRKPANPVNLWSSYFTSSNRVKEFRKLHGEPDIIKLHKVFSDEKQALAVEERFLRWVGAAESLRWLNARNGNKEFHPDEISTRKMRESKKGKPNLHLKGKKLSEEHRAKLSAAKIGKPRGPVPEHIGKAISIALTGKPLSREHRESISKAKKGKRGHPCTPAMKEAVSRAQKGKPKSLEHRQKLREYMLRKNTNV